MKGIHLGDTTPKNCKTLCSTIQGDKYSAKPPIWPIWIEMQEFWGTILLDSSSGDWSLSCVFKKPLPLCLVGVSFYLLIIFLFLSFWLGLVCGGMVVVVVYVCVPHLKSPDRASKKLQGQRTGLRICTTSEILGLDSKELQAVSGIPPWKTPSLCPNCSKKVNTESRFRRCWIINFRRLKGKHISSDLWKITAPFLKDFYIDLKRITVTLNSLLL